MATTSNAAVVKSLICSVVFADSSLWSEQKEQARVFLKETEEKCVQDFNQFCDALTTAIDFLRVCQVVELVVLSLFRERSYGVHFIIYGQRPSATCGGNLSKNWEFLI